MRHVAGFSNSTKIRFIVNGFGMYGTVNDIYTKTATAIAWCRSATGHPKIGLRSPSQ
jgi:hypothetical protein